MSTAVTRLVKGQYATVTTLPTCDICSHEGYRPVRMARYDFRTVDGQWANGCRQHYFERRADTSLGVGKGQRLYLPGELPANPIQTPPGLLNPRGTPSHANDL